jgi:hypothetical protein
VTCFLCGLCYAKIELFSVRGPCQRFIGDSEDHLHSVVASRSQESVSQGHEAVKDRNCEDSAVKC